MSTIQEQLARTERLTDLGSKSRDLMIRAMPGVVNDGVVSSLQEVVADLDTLAASADPDDQLSPRAMIEQLAADMTEWTARAHDSMNHAGAALEWYQRAKHRFAQLGNSEAVRRLEDRAAELRLRAGQDIDGEFKRAQAHLQEVEAGTLEEAKALISLGELASRAGDDHGALQWLVKAEHVLSREPFLLPDASSMLEALAGSLAAIHGGSATAGSTSIEHAMALRTVHQRLYFALSNAYRTTDPDKSAEYGARVEQMDTDRSSGGLGSTLLDAMKKSLE
jgi:hypothetical protein